MSEYTDITPEQLVNTLVNAYETYTDEVKKKVRTGINKISREAKQEVISLSRKGKKPKKDGYTHYKDGWINSAIQDNGVFGAAVHNKKYQLTHLLEFGHLTRKGTGRTAGQGKDETRAFPHIAIAQEHAEEKVDKLLEDL